MSGNNWTSKESPVSETPLPFTPIEDSDISKSTNRFTSNTTYDDAGNVTTDNKFRSMSFSYDAAGRMVKTSKTGVPDAFSVYDANGVRVAEKVNDIWRFLIYDVRGNLVAEYGGLQPSDDGGIKYFMQDYMGSTRAILSNTGVVQTRMDYQAFGGDIGASIGLRTQSQGFGSPNNLRLRYGMTERDEASGLEHTWFRKYENQAGRWTSPDPYIDSINLANPQSFNRYTYVENQPTSYIDPSGLERQVWIFAVYCIDREGFPYICGIGIIFTYIPTGGSGGMEHGGGGGGAPAQQKKECPVEPLKPVTDPDAKRLEDGNRVNLDGLSQATRDALVCLQEQVVPSSMENNPQRLPISGSASETRNGRAVGFRMESAYRPEAYQSHLFEIRDKLNKVRKYGKECAERKRELENARADHNLGRTVAETNSRHSSGKGFDMPIYGYKQSQITAFAKKCGLKRLLGVPDEESHFYMD